MSEKERAEILEALNDLPHDDKQFVLGYAAGVTAKVKEENTAQNEKAN